jgi:hypothetical protein
MNNELERMRKEAIIVLFEELTWHLPGRKRGATKTFN